MEKKIIVITSVVLVIVLIIVGFYTLKPEIKWQNKNYTDPCQHISYTTRYQCGENLIAMNLIQENCTPFNDTLEKDNCYLQKLNTSQQSYFCDLIKDNITKERCTKRIIFLQYIENNSLKISEKLNINYISAFNKVIEGNAYVISEDLSDSCAPYRYFHRGCYYAEDKNYFIWSIPLDYNLSSDEIKELCYKLVHKGGVVWCFKTLVSQEECMKFANTNTYLRRICLLEQGKVIPSQFAGINPFSDSNETIEPVKYSELV